MNTIRKYIIVDDDQFSNILCGIEIENAVGEAEITTFTVPEKALAYIRDEFGKQLGLTILFLDINMPTLSGWEFMKQYDRLDETTRKQIRVYIVSSSVDDRDKTKAKANNSIMGLISKPLNQEAIISIAQSGNHVAWD